MRTHMENIFQRLHVSSRTAALARAFPEHTAERLDASYHPVSNTRTTAAPSATSH